MVRVERGIRDKQTNLDKGSGGGSARGGREVCGRVQAASFERGACQVPTLNCGTPVLPGCTKQWLPARADLSGGQRQPPPRSPSCPPFIKSLPDGSDSAIRATAEPRQFLLHSLITPCLIESQ